MYYIDLEEYKEITFNNEKIMPDIIIKEEDDPKIEIVIFVKDNKFYILEKEKDNWIIKQCIFNKNFVEVLRLLPEDPALISGLKNSHYNQLLKLWQSEEFQTNLNFTTKEDIENLMKKYFPPDNEFEK